MGPTSPSPQTSSSLISTAKLDFYDISPYVTAPEIFNRNIQLLKLKIQSILDPSETMDSFSIKQNIEEELSALLGYSISEILPVITKNSTTVPNELTASTSQITEIKHPSLTKRPLQLSTLATESHPKSNLVGKVESQIHTMFSSPITTKNFSESAIAITTTPSTMITSQPSMQPSLSEIKTQPATYNVKSTPSKIYCFPTAIIPLPETSPSSTYFYQNPTLSNTSQ